MIEKIKRPDREQRPKSELCRDLEDLAISGHDFVGTFPNINWPGRMMGTFQCTLNKQTNEDGQTDE